MTGTCVLDSSMLIKALIKPNPSLSPDVYNRVSTLQKCIQILRYIKESGIEIIIPKICVIEIATVISRLVDCQKSHLIGSRPFSTCTVIHEKDIFNDAWEIAEKKGCSGFDAYFITVASLWKISLFPDDSGMHHHAKKKSLN